MSSHQLDNLRVTNVRSTVESPTKPLQLNTVEKNVNKTYIAQNQGFTIPDNATADQFITVWQTFSGYDGQSGNFILLPFSPEGHYNFTVNWGDGTSRHIVKNKPTSLIYHKYATAGQYMLIMNGTISGWRMTFMNGDASNEFLSSFLDILQWGSFQLGNSPMAFRSAYNLVVSATDAPDLSETNDMTDLFSGTSLSTTGNFNDWNVSTVTNMEGLFDYSKSFNQPLDKWDVSHVTKMSNMFTETAFNQPINNWDVSHVTNMERMFASSDFNQPLDHWDVSQVKNMEGMFYGSTFNQPLNTWDVSSVTSFYLTFGEASAFNQPLDRWDVSNVKDMGYMFIKAYDFNQPLASWNISAVTRLHAIFAGVKLSTENYDKLLESWAKLDVHKNLTLDGGNSLYSQEAEAARSILMRRFYWTIKDGGLDPNATNNGVKLTVNAPKTFLVGLVVIVSIKSKIRDSRIKK